MQTTTLDDPHQIIRIAQVENREIRLTSRPRGMPTAANFTLVQTKLEPLQERQVLVQNLFMAVDPHLRGRMSEGTSALPPMALGAPLEGAAVGVVVASRAREFKPGDTVTSNAGWREFHIAAPAELHPVSREIRPLSLYLGALGLSGMTAWAGLKLAEVKPGDTVFISGAAGGIGSVAGQLARIQGCRVIGSACSEEKVKYLRDACGFDAAFNCKTGPVLEQLQRAAPGGIDVYFDNVGGETLEAALATLRVHGRIIVCGGLGNDRGEMAQPGPANLVHLMTKRLTMKGLFVRDWLDRQAEFEREVGGHFRAGMLQSRESVVKGIGEAVNAFVRPCAGSAVGTLVVDLT